jgi:hypothetical protein
LRPVLATMCLFLMLCLRILHRHCHSLGSRIKLSCFYVLLLGLCAAAGFSIDGSAEDLDWGACTCSRRLRMWSEVYTSDITSAVLWKEGGGSCCADCLVDKFKWVFFKILYILFIYTPPIPNFKLLCLF